MESWSAPEYRPARPLTVGGMENRRGERGEGGGLSPRRRGRNGERVSDDSAFTGRDMYGHVRERGCDSLKNTKEVKELGLGPG